MDEEKNNVDESIAFLLGNPLGTLKKGEETLSIVEVEKKEVVRETSLAFGTLVEGTPVKSLSEEGRTFSISKQQDVNFVSKGEDSYNFEVDGKTYNVKTKHIKDLVDQEGNTLETEELVKLDESLPLTTDSIQVLKDHLLKAFNILTKLEEDGIEKAKKTETSSPPKKADLLALEFAYKAYMGKSKGKKREEMPQIDIENLDDFLIHYSKTARIKKGKRALKNIKPTQGQLNEDKIVERIVNKSDNWKTRKYILSIDNYLLDGHHDWAHGLEEDEDYEVDIYRVNIPINKLLGRTKQMKISKREDINGKKLKKALETITKAYKSGNSDITKEDYKQAVIKYSRLKKALE